MGERTLRVVAAKNSQAKNISTASVTATTLHAAACMRVQKLTNSKMSAGGKESKLNRNWQSCRVLIMEEICMISALLFNKLDYRAMLGRRESHHLSPDEYHRTGNAFGRIPITLYLGDFLQLRPTGQLSLVADMDEKDKGGNLVYNDVPPEVTHAQAVFDRVHDVFELRGTMRFVPGDSLVELLQCMRAGSPSPEEVWTAFTARCVSGKLLSLDQQFFDENFRSGFCMSSHWNSLTRMMNRRAILDAACSQVPLVMLQCADERMNLDTDATRRLLNIFAGNKKPSNAAMPQYSSCHASTTCFRGRTVVLRNMATWAIGQHWGIAIALTCIALLAMHCASHFSQLKVAAHEASAWLAFGHENCNCCGSKEIQSSWWQNIQFGILHW